MTRKAYITPQSHIVNIEVENALMDTSNLKVVSGSENEVTDPGTEAASNRQGFDGFMWDNIE
ncbi:MAG: hypothetical protein SPD56_05530 [Alloprevotella sp.]|nr:hypothetical protein [Bacteroidales bacterium]MDY4568423.1 hypothetical protein [Alloprevotella sp.]